MQASVLAFVFKCLFCPRKTSMVAGGTRAKGEVAEDRLQGRLAKDVLAKRCKDNPKFQTERQKLPDSLLYILVTQSLMVGKQRSAQAQ